MLGLVLALVLPFASAYEPIQVARVVKVVRVDRRWGEGVDGLQSQLAPGQRVEEGGNENNRFGLWLDFLGGFGPPGGGGGGGGGVCVCVCGGSGGGVYVCVCVCVCVCE